MGNKVSALMITYNRAAYLRESIASVLAQTHPVHELVIIDDGSEEDVPGVVNVFKDGRVRYFRLDHTGKLPRLRNLALSHATGDYAAFIDSDDRWHPEKIAMHLHACESAGARISVSDCQYFDAGGPLGKSIGQGLSWNADPFQELLVANRSFAFGSNLFFQLDIDGKQPRFDESLYAGEHDFMMLMCAWYPSAYIPNTLNFIRKHEGNISTVNPVIRATATIEYNITLGKLLQMKKISPGTFRSISGNNLVKAGAEYYRQNNRRKALKLAWKGWFLNPTSNHLKVVAKMLTGTFQ